MAQRARGGTARRPSCRKTKLLKPELVPSRKRSREDPTPGGAQGETLPDQVAERVAQLRDWANTWPSTDPPCTTLGKRRKIGKQNDDVGTVVVSNRGYVVVAQPPMYVAPQIRVLEKNLVVDHALLCCEREDFTSLSIEDWCTIASVEPDSKGLGPTQETLAAGENASSFTLCVANVKSRQLVGYVYAGFKPDARQLIISHVKVDTAERGKGLGTLLIRAAELHAKGRGWNYDLCKLEVMEANEAAKRCYARSGFRYIKSGYRTQAGCSLRWELWRKVNPP